MPQLKPREVKDICLASLWDLFDGKITKEEHERKINEVQRQLALREPSAPNLFDLSEISKGG